MMYILWPMIGVVVAMVFGVGPRRRAYRPNASGSLLAGAFGAIIGGIVSNGMHQAMAGTINLTGVLGAMFGSILFCWAVRDRAEDIEP